MSCIVKGIVIVLIIMGIYYNCTDDTVEIHSYNVHYNGMVYNNCKITDYYNDGIEIITYNGNRLKIFGTYSIEVITTYKTK